MSLLPIILQDLLDDDLRRRNHHHHRGGHHLELYPELAYPSLSSLLLHPLQHAASQHRAKDTTGEGDGFKVRMDVQQFAPEEITVKVTGDSTVVVEGKHEERRDGHGTVSRHFVRKYVLPEGHDVSQVASALSSDGVLTITAPKKKAIEAGAKTIPIIHTGPVKAVSDKKETEE